MTLACGGVGLDGFSIHPAPLWFGGLAGFRVKRPIHRIPDDARFGDSSLKKVIDIHLDPRVALC